MELLDPDDKEILNPDSADEHVDKPNGSDNFDEAKPLIISETTWFHKYMVEEGIQIVHQGVQNATKGNTNIVDNGSEILGIIYEKLLRQVERDKLTNDTGNINGYVFVASKRLVIDQSRSKDRRSKKEVELDFADFTQVDDSMENITDRLLFEEMYSLVWDHLNDAEKIVFATYYHGFSGEESAVFLNISYWALKSRRHRMWLKIRNILHMNGYTSDMFD